MGKKKRRERSALETETSTPKPRKANMAAVESEEDSLNVTGTSGISEEPNLLEPKKMPIDVQISVSNILREQKNITTETALLKETIQSNEKEVRQLKVKLSKLLLNSKL